MFPFVLDGVIQLVWTSLQGQQMIRDDVDQEERRFAILGIGFVELRVD
jgi:hypothetical protein